ncbi:Heterokaryon incompatibility protein 6, OR allele [Colletotrichum tanaceti]|uniref:Heterokaryon incompatibility protein 6, OR allele n=1 Tax=Colletotrichum tanaceti TaxID=1306861 RepID=A0A4V6DH51_9PEZI|nr:Heterokaryon incompatibility protein 6, OR allele [Colletotrichum tanaceti]TKW48746.1 Heterokaryon incompatibility protein 6, OR allele [Colletotrichum tanaceti]
MDGNRASMAELQTAVQNLGYDEDCARPRLQDPKRQIRLFALQPGDPGSTIRGAFSTANIDVRPSYHCVSYVWGDALNTTDIVVGGRAFTVTTSLFSALCRIRSSRDTIHLWADALCINQEDNEEKRLQVNMMFEIYSRCAGCFIWMGEIATDREGLTVDAARVAFDFMSLLLTAGPEDPWPEALAAPESRLSVGRTLRALMECPWWSRMWTLQECVAPGAATVLWGPLSIPWASVLGAGSRILRGVPSEGWEDHLNAINWEANFSAVAVPLLSLDGETKARHDAECRIPALDLFWRYTQRQATDPRDRVYALLPWVGHALESVASSDYEVGYEELYGRVTADLIRSDRSLLPLMGRPPGEVPLEGPSWVLDWVRMEKGIAETADGLNFWVSNLFHDEFDACRGLPAMETGHLVSDDGRRLHLRGVCVDTVAMAAVPPSPKETLGDGGELDGYTAEPLVARWRRHMAADVLDFLARQEGGSDRNAAMDKLLRLNQEIEEVLNGMMISEEKEDPGIEGLTLRDSWRGNWLACGKRDVFVTSSVGFGLGPCSARPGDEVWVLCEGRMPFLLRPVRKQEQEEQEGDDAGGGGSTWPPGFYRLVGECYMHGVMEGQAVEGEAARLRTITIC